MYISDQHLVVASTILCKTHNITKVFHFFALVCPITERPESQKDIFRFVPLLSFHYYRKLHNTQANSEQLKPNFLSLSHVCSLCTVIVPVCRNFVGNIDNTLTSHSI